MADQALNSTSRDDLPDLLTRPPSGTREFVTEWAKVLIDPVRQLWMLAELYEDGLISRTEFDRYKARVGEL